MYFKGLPPFIKWALSTNENYREEMEIWPCNDYIKYSESAQVTLRWVLEVNFKVSFLPKKLRVDYRYGAN